MEGRTAPLLRALSNVPRLVVLVELADSEGLTHAELIARTGLHKSTLSNTLTDLEQLGLAIRPPTNRGSWRCAAQPTVRKFLAAAGGLAVEMGAADAADEDLRDRFTDPAP